jgi:hypothetical protein
VEVEKQSMESMKHGMAQRDVPREYNESLMRNGVMESVTALQQDLLEVERMTANLMVTIEQRKRDGSSNPLTS